MFTSDRGGCCLQPCTLLVTGTGTHRLRVAVMTTNLMHGWTHTCCGLARSPRHSDATHLVHYAARESQSPAPDGRLSPVRSRHRRRRPPQPAGQRYRAAVALLLLICPCRAILTCFARNTIAPGAPVFPMEPSLLVAHAVLMAPLSPCCPVTPVVPVNPVEPLSPCQSRHRMAGRSCCAASPFAPRLACTRSSTITLVMAWVTMRGSPASKREWRSSGTPMVRWCCVRVRAPLMRSL